MEKDERVALFSLSNNVSLVIIKYILALLSGSTALVADVIHSLTDVVGSVTLLIGLRVSRRKSKAFPYGLYKVENLVALVTSIAIFFAGYEILREVFSSKSAKELTHLPVALAGVLITILMTWAFSHYELRVGRELNSPSLIANGEHVKTDLLSSVVILVGLAGYFMGLKLDRIAAVVVVAFIARSGVEIALNAIRVLLDASLDYETLDKVKSLISSEPKVKAIRSLKGRNSGRYKFIETEIMLRESGLEKAHNLARRLEKNIRSQVAGVDHVLIHYEPMPRTSLTYAVPLSDPLGKVSEHFGEAPYFALFTVNLQEKRIASEAIYHNRFLEQEKAKGIAVSEWLVGEGVDVVFVRRPFHGRGPSYVFSDAEVEVTITKKESIDELKIEVLPEEE